MKKYLNKAELIDHLGVSQSTLQRMMRNGFPFIRYKNKGVEKVVFDIEAVKNWQNKPKSSIITNADRIRMMSDEELAKFLYELETQYAPVDLEVEDNWKDWLQQEVDIVAEIEKDTH